jgi:class 3 adenylate cyclase/tetratricopeptide (TPR) repeat protein
LNKAAIETPEPATTDDVDAERRYVTVLFCDLVGSTPLSEHLDPEDMRDLVIAYRELCANVVATTGGQIARYVGDGVLVLFGYPRAYEEDAVTSIKVALGILAAMRKLSDQFQPKTGRQLAVHIGIHTGLVVAGDIGHGELREGGAVIGETPNIAARLQQLAGPNTVLISDSTYRLLSDRYDCQSLGELSLKGVSRRVNVLQVRTEQRPHGQSSGRANNRIVGREQELATLRLLWWRAARGEGQIVLMQGEAGIGKSALLESFGESIAEEAHSFLMAHCARDALSSALLPIVELLRREFDLTPGGDPAIMRERIDRAVASSKQTPAAAGLFAFLLSIPSDSDPTSEISSHSRREQTKLALVDWLVARAQEKPLLLAIENLHWADPSTIEFLGRLVQEIPSTRAMLLLTSRPEIPLALDVGSSLTEIKLSPLKVHDTKAMIHALTGDRMLTSAFVDQIVAKTDGIPLFIEELTRMMLDFGSLGETNHGDEHWTTSFPAGIPATLRSLLMARCDRLGVARSLAQLASALGREFPHRLLEIVAPVGGAELQAQLATLIRTGFLVRHGGQQTTYSFRHSLIQDVAYGSLLRKRRRSLHERVATVLAEQFSETVDAQPELLAYHYELGGRGAEAVDLWRRAGDRALERSANVEAAAHFARGIRQNDLLPMTTQRLHAEVTLQIGHGTALIATNGYGASEVEEAFFKAYSACGTIGATPQLFPALRGLQSFHQVRGPLDTARKIGEQLLGLAEREADRSLISDVNRRLSWCLFCMGRLSEAKAVLDRAREAVTEITRQEIRFPGAHPSVLWLVNSAWMEWFSGDAAKALERSKEALALTNELQHPMSRIYALCMSAALHQFRGEAAITEMLAGDAVAVASEHGLPYWIAWGQILHGWAVAAQGRRDAGAALLTEGIGAYRATGAVLFLPHSLALLAEIQHSVGRSAEALVAITDAWATAQDNQVHFFDPELHRIRGNLLQSSGDVVTATAAYAEALEIARAQGAHALEASAQAALANMEGVIALSMSRPLA